MPVCGCVLVSRGGVFGSVGASPDTPAGTSIEPAGLVSDQMPLVPITSVEPSFSTWITPPVPRMPTVAVGVVILYALRLVRPTAPVTVRIAPFTRPKKPRSLPSFLPSYLYSLIAKSVLGCSET